MTENEFQNLLEWLRSAGNDAGEEYENCRKLLIHFFERRQCGDRAGELVDSVFDVVAKKLSKGDPVPTALSRPYLRGVAQNILRDYWKKPTVVSLASEGGRTPNEAQDPRNTRSFWEEWKQDQLSRANFEALHECLDNCLQSWPGELRNLILEYHRCAGHEKIENRKRLAASLTITLNALAIRTHRLRDRLEKCIMKCIGPK